MPDQNKDLPSLDELQKRIDSAKPPSTEPDGREGRDMSNASRLVIDLVSGVIVGLLIGYGLDKWFNTLPLCLIIGLFLGMAAGVRNMLRSAKQMDEENKV
jgi:ATP synthase protein I